MFVKICGVTTVEDALLAAGLGADALGLNFYSGSPRRIGRATARDIVRRVPPEVLSVGVFRNEVRERVDKQRRERRWGRSVPLHPRTWLNKKPSNNKRARAMAEQLGERSIDDLRATLGG